MIAPKLAGNLWIRMGSVIWWLSVGLSVIAWVPVILGSRQELVGNSAFALLVSAAFANAATIASYWLQDGRFAISRVVWMLVATVSLAFALVIASQEIASAKKDASTVLLFIALVLSFPVGFLGALIVSAMPALLGQSNTLALILMWLLFTVLGYLQWFIFIPAFLRRRSEGKTPIGLEH